jgi:hypothetical protein
MIMTDDNKDSKQIIPANLSLGLPADVESLSVYAAADEFFGVDFLRCNGKSGKLSYGIDSTQFPAGAKLAALIALTKVGFIDWEDGQIETQAWLKINDAAKLKELRQSLGKLDASQWPGRDPKGRPLDPFRESVRLPMLWIEKRKPLLFSSSGETQCRAVKRLAKACVEQARAEPGMTVDRVPVVKIDVDCYQHSVRSIGEIFFPVFEIVDWVPTAQMAHVLIDQGFAAAFGISHREALCAGPARPRQTPTPKPRRSV